MPFGGAGPALAVRPPVALIKRELSWLLRDLILANEPGALQRRRSAKADRDQRGMFTNLFDAGPGGLTTAEWNAKAKIEWDGMPGLGGTHKLSSRG